MTFPCFHLCFICDFFDEITNENNRENKIKLCDERVRLNSAPYDTITL